MEKRRLDWELERYRRQRATYLDRLEEEAKRKRNLITSHVCYGCPYSVSVDNGTRLFLPVCATGCMRGYRNRPYKGAFG